jgi:hypothetical protein
MAIKYSSIFHSKALQNLLEIGIVVLKANHLATLATAAAADPKIKKGYYQGPRLFAFSFTFCSQKWLVQDESKVGLLRETKILWLPF